MTTENKQLTHDVHLSTLVVGERGTGKTTRAILVAINIVREGGRFLSNIDINPLSIDAIVPMPFDSHWDNVFVRLPDSPHRFSLHSEIIGEGWYIHNNIKKYSVTVFDECANYLNARKWDDDSRQDFIDALIHQRKRGYKEYYLAHSLEQIDSQVRISYISSVELLLNRPPQLSRRWLGGSSPVVCTLKRDSDGKFPTDVTDRKVWTRGLVSTQSYSKSNSLVWKLYSTSQMFDFEHYRSNTSPLVPDGTQILGFPVHNIFVGYQYVTARKDSRGNLKRERKQFAYFRMGSFSVISPRLLHDCYYVQSKTLEFFIEQQKHYNVSDCVAPAFATASNVSKVNVSNGQEKKYYVAMSLLMFGLVFIVGGSFYYLGSSIGIFPSFHSSAPVQPVTPPHPVDPKESKVEPHVDAKIDDRFKKPVGKPAATYPVCEFFNLLELDRVTYFNDKHMIDRDWFLQYFRSNPIKVTNYFIDQATGMPRYTLLFYSKQNSSQIVDSVSETELFNFGWRSAVTGYKNSYLAVYNPNMWVFFPVPITGSASSSPVSNVFSLPSVN